METSFREEKRNNPFLKNMLKNKESYGYSNKSGIETNGKGPEDYVLAAAEYPKHERIK
jgi:hypothetical protein